MKNDAAWMAENMPHLYGGAAGAVGGMGAVVGGIQNAMGAGNSVLENVDNLMKACVLFVNNGIKNTATTILRTE